MSKGRKWGRRRRVRCVKKCRARRRRRVVGRSVGRSVVSHEVTTLLEMVVGMLFRWFVFELLGRI